MINSTQIQNMILSSLSEGETTGEKIVHGVVSSFSFNSERLETQRPLAEEIVKQLPLMFRPSHEGGGGGWTFLNLVQDKDGNLWTGFQRTADELLCLLLGLGMAKILLPREMWPMLPGGVPYICLSVNDCFSAP
jgi:hypothetical protein